MEVHILNGLELAHLLVDTVADKKASDILILDLQNQSMLTDYFLICTGENSRQIGAIADSIIDDARAKGQVRAFGREGTTHTGWVLVDFADLIVHIFSPEKRAFYDLEELWRNSHVVLRMP